MQTVLLILLFGILFAGIGAGIPVMFILLGSSIFIAFVASLIGAFDLSLFNALPVRIFGILENSILYSVPLFILMGKLLEHSDLAERSLSTIASIGSKPTRTSISLSVILVAVLIACSSGIVGATITMLAAMALPVMTKARIHERMSAGLIVASGSLGQIIPPSIVLILLSDQISSAYMASQRELGNFSPEPVSVGHLFAAALIPGLLLAAAYSLYTIFKLAGPNRSDLESLAQPVDWIGILAMLTLLGVPASILYGVATPTEAAAIGVFLLLAIIAFTRRIDILTVVARETVELTGAVFGIIIAASVFALVVRGMEGDALIAQLLSALPDGALWAVLSVMGIIFLLGFIMEFVEITYVVVPITAPALFAMGIDPIWFAVLVALNLQISFLTPPMGISLFYYKSVAATPTIELVRGVIPFIIVQLALLIAVLTFPQLATWLPSVLV